MKSSTDHWSRVTHYKALWYPLCPRILVIEA
jgi:hypothetical protein